jgi:RNase adapter protein RapZ
MSIESAGLKHGPVDDKVASVSCLGLRNPYSRSDLRELNGLDPLVQAYVLADPNAAKLLSAAESIYKAYGRVVFVCMGGRHRSVTMAETLAKRLGLTAIHRDLKVHE